jgi:hypothetical protein
MCLRAADKSFFGFKTRLGDFFSFLDFAGQFATLGS